MNNERKTIKEYRKMQGVTQLQLAFMTGLSLSTIANVESFRRSPQINDAIKIVSALGITLDSVIWIKDEAFDNKDNIQ